MRKSALVFIKELQKFDYHAELRDRIWDVILPDNKGKYYWLKVTKYQEVFYIFNIDGDLPTLEISLGKNAEIKISQDFHSYSYGKHIHNPEIIWDRLLIDACHWFTMVKKDWVKSNKKIWESYPLNRRYGIVSHSIIRAYLPEIYRIDKALGKQKAKKFINLVDSGYFLDDENTKRKCITANEFFEYCKIAYMSSDFSENKVDASLTGRELYKQYADGRNEGLLEINGSSPKEFANWIDGKHPKKTTGGHPWEIRRGGNTTHIDLFVSRATYPGDKPFSVCLNGPSSSRLKETICMFLGIHDSGLPITIVNPEGIRKRLLGQDNIGIIPSFHSLHRANQHYGERQSVYDVLHYDDLGRYKRGIQPFITWEPLPILKPR